MRWVRTPLVQKLFLSSLLVILVGMITLFVVSEAVAPTFLNQRMAGMMGPGRFGRMGGVPAYLDASLRAAFRTAMLQSLLVSAGAAALVAILASLFIAHQIVRPIRTMAGATQRIAAGHYAERVPLEPNGAHDEIGALAASFNEMAASLEQTEERRLALLADVAHEMRTPIALLQGSLEGLLDGVVEASPQTWARLHDEAGRLRRLVDDLQELSRAEARQIVLTLRPVPPSVIVQSAADHLSPQFHDKGLNLHVTVPPMVPAVHADQDRAVQVLTNLLANALRYTPAPGGVEVDVTQRKGVVAFAVRDTGIGLAPGHLNHLYERFYRVDKFRSRALGGSGIGLTIAKALVDAMGGEIRAESAGQGQGSTFTFTLPVAEPHTHGRSNLDRILTETRIAP